jgi:hypothetical protein
LAATERCIRLGELDRPHEDVAKTRGDRTDRRLNVSRQRIARLGQTLGDLLSSKVDIRALS